MTDPVVRLATSRLSVEPGGQARTTVTVRNPGAIVESFTVTVVGSTVEGWTQALPAEVQVYPGQEASATIVFTAPAGAGTRSGSYPFGVHVQSVVDASSSAVAEGDLDVGRVFGLQAKLTPVTSRGRWRGRHRIELTNWGNTPVRLRLVASDPDERLAFLINPEVLDVPLGGSGQATLKVKTRDPFLRGTPVRLPFQVVGEPDPPETRSGPPPGLGDPRRAAVDGALTQRPILSRAVVVAGVLAVLALGGLTAFSLRGNDERPTFEEAGSPPTPVLEAVPLDSEQIMLSWPAQQQIELYNVFQVSEDGAQTFNNQQVDGAVNTLAIGQLTPDSGYCFRMQAVRGEFTSPMSGIVCTATPAAPVATESPTGPSTGAPTDPSGSAAPGTSTPPPETTPGTEGPPLTTAPTAGPTVAFLPTEYVAIVFIVPADQPEARPQAEQRAGELSTESMPALVLNSTDYPDMGLIPGVPFNPSYIVYVGPFENMASAEDYCTANLAELPTGCTPVQPSPNG